MKNRSFSIAAALLFLCLSAPATVMGEDYLEGVDIHGVVSQGFIVSDEYNYLSHKSKDGSFEYNEVAVNFGKQLTNKLGLGVQFFARDVGDVGNNELTLDWAYGDYRFQDWLGLRFGKVKLPLGLWNEIRDFDMLRPWVVLPQNTFYNDLLRTSFVAVNGLGLYGNIPAGAAGNIDYFAVAGNQYTDPKQGYQKIADESFGTGFEQVGAPDNDVSYTASLRWNTPVNGLIVGASGYTTTASQSMQMQTQAGNVPVDLDIDAVYYGFMVEYIWENLSLWGEYTVGNVDSVFTIMGSETKTTTKPETWYLGAAYRFIDWFQLGTYYAVNYVDGDDKDGSKQEALGRSDHKAWEKDFAVTLRFDINEHWIFKMEGHMVDGTANVLFSDNPNSDLSEQNFSYGVAKLSVSF